MCMLNESVKLLIVFGGSYTYGGCAKGMLTVVGISKFEIMPTCAETQSTRLQHIYAQSMQLHGCKLLSFG